ncbi:CTD kinase subunit gamma, partial [Tremellales sp. Uapishka_1]
MSIDPFEARLQFLQLLRKLGASRLSIDKAVAFAVKHGSKCGEDLWECILDESAKVSAECKPASACLLSADESKASLNTRINILYFLDSLADASNDIGPPDAPYLKHMSSDLGTIVDSVVPDSREGVLNLRSARQILDSWHTRRAIDAAVVDEAIKKLERREFR